MMYGITSNVLPAYFCSRNEPRSRSTLNSELSGADPARAAAERPIGAIGRIEGAVEMGADINVALRPSELLT
jgi:hypothetical protein